MSVLDNWATSCVVTRHLVDTLWVQTDFWSGEYTMMTTNGRSNIRVRSYLNAMQALADFTVTLPAT